MQTINNRMTETQIADLFSLAVQLQVKAEESDDRDTAILAYSIQNACSNLTESQREFRAADATIHNLELQLTDMAVQLANAESKCRELAAENAGLKGVVSEINNELYGQGFQVSGWHLNGALEPLDNWFTDNGWGEQETPATDAFLAEVRARAVDDACLKISNAIINCYKDEQVGLDAAATICGDFASEIRKGAEL